MPFLSLERDTARGRARAGGRKRKNGERKEGKSKRERGGGCTTERRVEEYTFYKCSANPPASRSLSATTVNYYFYFLKGKIVEFIGFRDKCKNVHDTKSSIAREMEFITLLKSSNFLWKN